MKKIKSKEYIILIAFFLILVLVIGAAKEKNGVGIITPSSTAHTLATVDLLHNPPPSSWIPKESLPGNSFETAVPLQPGVDTQGTLSADNILDFYSFNIKSPSKIILNNSNLPKVYAWAIYDQTQQEIASSIRTGVTEGSSTLIIQNPGTYYIKVTTNYADGANYPYTIRLNIVPFF